MPVRVLFRFRNGQSATGALITENVAFGFFERHVIKSCEEGISHITCIIVEDVPKADAIVSFRKVGANLKAET